MSDRNVDRGKLVIGILMFLPPLAWILWMYDALPSWAGKPYPMDDTMLNHVLVWTVCSLYTLGGPIPTIYAAVTGKSANVFKLWKELFG